VASDRHIFRWDLDKTYLKTEFDSVRDLVRTARLTAEERENIPGSAALIRAVRDFVPPGGEHLVYFISGSPEQMRPVLERKFALDGFMPDGFVLKPTVSNLLRGRFRSVRNQIAYKLRQLLQGRADAPVGSRETLFGDDAESDALTYSLYADFVSGRVSRDHVRSVLRLAGAYADEIREIDELMEAIVHEDCVTRIILHLDRKTPPAAFLPYAPRLVPTRNHLQTVLILTLDGTLPSQAIAQVAEELVEQYGFDPGKLTELAEDIFRRTRLRYAREDAERVASELASLSIAAESPTRCRALLADLAHRIASTKAVERRGFERAEAPRDFERLLREEQERTAEHRRARKLERKSSRPTRHDEFKAEES
jgi:hypothetical protein